MALSRKERQGLIRQLVRQGAIRTQNELVAQLAEAGFEVTQATVSRDIAELDLRKDAQGCYVLAEEARLRSIAASAIRETRRAGNQVILLTKPGNAQSVAAALDDAGLPEMLGCIAGDDTILVICAGDAEGERFQKAIDGLIA